MTIEEKNRAMCENKINAIKQLRQFTEETFGITLGLKESKDIIDSLVKQYTSFLAKKELVEATRKALREGVTYEFIRDLYAVATSLDSIY